MAKMDMIALDQEIREAMIKAFAEIGRTADLVRIAREVQEEVARAEAKHGPQSHRDGTGTGYAGAVIQDLRRFGSSTGPSLADAAKVRTDHYASINGGDALEWEQILTEELLEAYEESAPATLRAELIQVAAVAMAWIRDIDNRKA